MPTPLSGRSRNQRKAVRAAHLRPLQIWAPDTPRPGFEAACREQAARATAADEADNDLAGFLDAAFDDVARR